MANGVRRETKHVGSFVATDDAGEEYVLDVFVDFRYDLMRPGQKTVTRGIKEIKTQDGLSMRQTGEGTYQVAETGLVLHSSDPNAPQWAR
ncbi:MAG: hypothetical protein ABSH35_33080 [Isosphaeraceae bacterium]|jgi:hypothetical protein